MKIIYNEDLKINMFEIDFLKWWFNEKYTKLEQKYRRLHTLFQVGILSTNEAQNAYSNLIALYNEAETKRQRIQEIEVLNEMA